MYDDFIIIVAEYVAIVTLAMSNSYHILATQIEAKVDGASDSPHPASSIFCSHF